MFDREKFDRIDDLDRIEQLDSIEELEIGAITDTGGTLILTHSEIGSIGLFMELSKTSVTPKLQTKIDDWLNIDGNEITALGV